MGDDEGDDEGDADCDYDASSLDEAVRSPYPGDRLTHFDPRRWFLLGAGLSLASCQLVSGLTNLESLDGGGGSKSSSVSSDSSASGDMTATTGSGGAGVGGAGGGATSSVTSGTGGAGGAAELTACGGVTDAFNALDPAVWTTVGQAQVVNGKLRVTLSGAFSGVRFATPGTFHDCFASIRLVTGGSAQEAALLIERVSPFISEQIGYLGVSNTITQKPATLAMANASPQYLGIAFHGANVYFLYRSFLSWTLLASIPRAVWMDVPDNTIGLGVTNGTQGLQFSFDDFNVVPIQLADLP